jgi:hypothetical protein
VTNGNPQVVFGSLVPGGFFSSDPDDLHVPRSVRANNAGALNISNWQKSRKGYAGVTFPDGAGNVTTIYRTPEHGVAAWYHLIAGVYGFGASGKFTTLELAERYAGAETSDNKAVRAYCAGWNHAANGKLPEDLEISLNDAKAMLLLARAMFAHEAGKPSPLHDDQISFAITAERGGTLPD